MTDDLRLAFAHPQERAETIPLGRSVADRISVRDLIVDADIGAFQTERGKLQRLRFNVVVEVTPTDAMGDDDVDRIMSYDLMTDAITAELATARYNLLETLAENIAGRVLTEPRASRVFVRVEKLDRAPGALGVEIMRDRAMTGAAGKLADSLAPKVVFVTNASIADPQLGQAIGRLIAGQDPVILCVGMPDTNLPASDHPPVQRRIDLLAMDQNAWYLAGHDARCIVTGTRTELDWAMKNRQAAVWAPSKIVLDSVDPQVTGLRDGQSLAAWFARLMKAPGLLVLGAAEVSDPQTPLHSVTPGALL
jgi:dihydroneopterin aldolase